MLPRSPALALGLLLVIPATVRPAAIHVPADQPTIQAGIDAAVAGDTVLVAPGTYVGTGNKNLDFHGVDLVLRSEAGPTQTIIDVQGSVQFPARAFYLHSGETLAAGVEGFTIRNGFLLSQAFPEGVGGAVLCVDAACTFRSCSFEDNSVTFLGGGAIYCARGGLVLEDCAFLRNAARWAGAVDADRSTLAVERCLFERNVASLDGGAITINVCTGVGVSYSTFIENSSAGIGGAIDCEFSSAEFDHCTLFGNAAWGDEGGGGMFVGAGPVVITNTIIAFGIAGEAVAGGEPNPVLTCCDIIGNVGGDWVGAIAGQLGVNGNIQEDPDFCDPGKRDLHLHAGSPCAPGHSPPGCDLIGAWPVGCGVADVGEESPSTDLRLSVIPNPVRGVARFDLSSTVPLTTLNIFDSQGRLIEQLSSQDGQWQWTPGSLVPTGIYFARPEVAGATEAVKFLYLR
jgi:predicted outer membrane repeat protein